MINNPPAQVITPEFLFTLLSKEEGPTLDFKRKPYLIYAEDKMVKDKQRGELIKDILALANKILGEFLLRILPLFSSFQNLEDFVTTQAIK